MYEPRIQKLPKTSCFFISHSGVTILDLVVIAAHASLSPQRQTPILAFAPSQAELSTHRSSAPSANSSMYIADMFVPN